MCQWSCIVGDEGLCYLCKYWVELLMLNKDPGVDVHLSFEGFWYDVCIQGCYTQMVQYDSRAAR